MIMMLAKVKEPGKNIPFLATSIIPLEKVAPKSTPAAATISIMRSGATLAPIAELRKFTASLLTPTIKSDIASIKRTSTMIRKTLSIFRKFQSTKIVLKSNIMIILC